MYQYTQDWFSENIPAWEKLMPNKVVAALEVGSHEGRSAVWILQNLLIQEGTLVCIDTWGNEPYLGNNMDGVYERFQHNVSMAAVPTQTIVEIRKDSVRGMAELMNQGHFNAFDFIYIDACHRAVSTLTDACMAFQLLAKDGVMVFDDYLLGAVENTHVDKKLAIDSFVNTVRDFAVVVMNNRQVAVKKTRHI